MNNIMNKKLDRLKQWTSERMGNEAKTSVTDEFKALEGEMTLRHEGMDKLHSSMATFVRSLSKRKEAEDKEKMLPLDVLATAMIYHGEEFETDSIFGNCLIKMGLANERIARLQDTFVAKASESWLESTERALAQMKEYQAARRKLESRRLAYDATLSKVQKQKREDFRVEEELRAQRIKYEESNEDVARRMNDIQDMEAESVRELTAFLDAELEYYENARTALLKLRKEWPAVDSRRPSRRPSQHNTPREESPPPLPAQASIRSRTGSVSNSTYQSTESLSRRPAAFEGPTTLRSRNFAEPPSLPSAGHLSTANRNLRPIIQTQRTYSDRGPDPDRSYDNSTSSSPDRDRERERHYTSSPYDRHDRDPISPMTSSDSANTRRIISRTSSNTSLSSQGGIGGIGSERGYMNAANARKPPPPPVSRIAARDAAGRKGPPPPPPVKRPSLTGNGV